MNKVILTGRLTRDPELRKTASGLSTVSFSIAVDRGYKDNQGNKITDFINCVAWRVQADFMANYIRKGNLILVEGKITTRTYQTPDNQTRYVTEVVCDSVESLQTRSENTNNQQPGQYYQPQETVRKPMYQEPVYQEPSYANDYSSNSNFVPNEIVDDDLPF